MVSEEQQAEVRDRSNVLLWRLSASGFDAKPPSGFVAEPATSEWAEIHAQIAARQVMP